MSAFTPSSALRVLLVEDQPDTARTMQILLTRWGFEVCVASDGASALDAAPHFWPHVVLLDLGLPGMDGWQVAALLREQPCTRSAVMLAVTAYDQESAVERSVAAGLDDHLVKPVDPLALKGLLDRVQGYLTSCRP